MTSFILLHHYSFFAKMSLVTRPSDARRAALSEATKGMGEKGVPLVSNFFPLDRYFEAAHRVLDAFNTAFDARRLDDAYVYGKRFAIFSLEALPQHNYYESPRYTSIRFKNKQDMTEVILKLEKIAEWMDEEEKEKEIQRRRREAEERRREEERMKREAEAARVRLMQFQIDVDKKNRDMKNMGTNVQKSALDKLRRMNGVEDGGESDAFMNDLKRSFRGRRQSSTGSQEGNKSYVDNTFDEQRRQSTRQELGSRSSSLRSLDSQPLPPPLPVPLPPPHSANTSTHSSQHSSTHSRELPPPPSYNAIMDNSKRSNGDSQSSKKVPQSALEQAAAISAAAAGGATRREHQNLRVSGSVYANRELERHRRMAQKKEKVPMRVIKSQIHNEFQQLKNSKRIDVVNLSTHQGRFPDSTNGCAVISPLVVSHHLRSRSAVSNDEISYVIDKECGPLLSEIRGKLNLNGAALIIPSDVHDHLVDKKILRQDAFVGATGGNIMDRKHLAEFLRLLDSGEKNSHSRFRTGAALFFREHVVSLVKVPAPGGKWRYDFIDSLPSGSGMATRTRCHDLVALEMMLRYYASSRFSESNCDFIDKNDWDDCMADFDPRVFQCFVWGDVLKKRETETK